MPDCPLYEGFNSDNCQFCSQKTDCMLLVILEKIANIESVIEKIAAPARDPNQYAVSHSNKSLS